MRFVFLSAGKVPYIPYTFSHCMYTNSAVAAVVVEIFLFPRLPIDPGTWILSGIG
jgi:hypothetical protein